MFSSQVTRSQRWGVTTSLCSVNPHSRIHNQHDVNFEGHTATWIHIIGSDILLLYGSDENFDSIDWHWKKFPGFFWLTSLFQCLQFKGILQIKGWNFWSHKLKDKKKDLEPFINFLSRIKRTTVTVKTLTAQTYEPKDNVGHSLDGKNGRL